MLKNSIVVQVGNGLVGLGSPVAWVSSYDGVKTGKVVKITQRVSRYYYDPEESNTAIRLTVKEDKKASSYYGGNIITLRKLRNVISLDPQGVLPQTPEAGPQTDAPNRKAPEPFIGHGGIYGMR